jgi:single-strand DNA-binding protein
MNKIIIVGNACIDADLQKIGKEQYSVSRFSVAVNKRGLDKDGEKRVMFLGVVAWKKLAEICSQYVKKGMKIGVTGELDIRHYDDDNGVKKTVVEIIADEVEFLSKKDTDAKEDEMTPVNDTSLPF